MLKYFFLDIYSLNLSKFFFINFISGLVITVTVRFRHHIRQEHVLRQNQLKEIDHKVHILERVAAVVNDHLRL